MIVPCLAGRSLVAATLVTGVLTTFFICVQAGAEQSKNPAGSTAGAITDEHKPVVASGPAEGTTAPDRMTACCAAACIGGGNCGIYCEEITTDEDCEARYRFACPPEQALLCQGGSCICVD